MNKKNIYLMYAIAFFQGIVLYATISTLYREQRGLTLSDYAIIESFSYFFMLAFEIPFGFIADRIGYKKTLALSNGVYFLSKVVFWQAHGFGLFLLERFLMSIAFAGLSGVDTSVIYLSSEKDKTQKNFGWYASFGTAGMLTGCAVFTLFLSNDFSGCAFGTMISYGIAFLLTLFIDEVKGKAEGDERITVSNLLDTIKISIKDVKFLGFLLAAALLGNASWLISVMLYQDKYLLLGINEQQMGIITIGISIAGLFSFASDFFTKKLGKCKFLSLLCIVMCIASVWMGYTEFAFIAIICHFLVDVGYGLVTPLINEIENERVSVQDRATQLSVYGMIVDVISIVISIITSRVADISLTALFVFAAIEFGIAIVLVVGGKGYLKNK